MDTFDIPQVENRFDQNLAPFKGRVEKLKCMSKEGLGSLAKQERCYDLAYIDGSHMRDDVMADSIAAWPLLQRGGVIIWDDYEWRPELPLSAHEHQYRLLASGRQIIVEKTKG